MELTEPKRSAKANAKTAEKPAELQNLADCSWACACATFWSAAFFSGAFPCTVRFRHSIPEILRRILSPRDWVRRKAISEHRPSLESASRLFRVSPILFLSLVLFSFNATLFKAEAAAHFQTIKTFGFPDLLGSQPQAPLTEGSDGALYGTTYGAANKYAGTVFRINKDGTGYRALHIFSLAGGDGRRPYGPVIEAKDGALYGTTAFGGATGRGAIFKINKDGSGYVILHSLQGSPDEGAGCFAGLLEGSDGLLYGTTSSDGSYGDGAVFSLNKDGSNFQTLHHFEGWPADGSAPHGGLVEGLDGALYGTTTFGGASNAGCVFKLNKDGSDYSLLYSFGADDTDGETPVATLTISHTGGLYGCTSEGGITNGRGSYGIIFIISTDGSHYSVLHKFAGPPDDGITPWGALLEGNDGAVYGTSLGGGSQQFGTVFRLAPDGNVYTILHHFSDGERDGALPKAGLIQAKDGTLYGTTEEGGLGLDGTAFKLNTNGTGYSTLHDFSFSGGDGYYPLSLVVGTNGVLYGTTQMGGNADGAVFKLKQDGCDYRVLHRFVFAEGRGPFISSAVTEGILYGTTFQGGTNAQGIIVNNDLGTIFKLEEDGSNFTVLRYFGDFPGEGARPSGGLTKAQDGLLYGTAVDISSEGGAGTLFSFDPVGHNYVVLHTFGSIDSDGQNPSVAPIEGTDGFLYGTTRDGGGTGYGTVFKLSKDGTLYSVLHNFSTATGEGQNPWRLLEASDGMLYDQWLGHGFSFRQRWQWLCGRAQF